MAETVGISGGGQGEVIGGGGKSEINGRQRDNHLLFWKHFIPLTLISTSTGPYLKQKRVGYVLIFFIVVTENPSLGIALHLLPQF